MKLNARTVITVVAISALTNVALAHLAAARKA